MGAQRVLIAISPGDVAGIGEAAPRKMRSGKTTMARVFARGTKPLSAVSSLRCVIAVRICNQLA